MGGSNEIEEKQIPKEVYRAEYIDDTENVDLDDINPYSVLNISSNSSKLECRNSYFKLATVPNRRKRAEACLAYDVLCNKKKYKRIGNIFKVKEKDCFYCTVVGDLDLLKKKIQSNKNLLYEKDELKRSLLYLSARNGYYNITEYLINKGININDVQNCGSTALHGAAYYGQTLIIQLLIDHGIDTSIKNDYGHTAADEAKTPFIKELIVDSHTDKIKNFYQDLLSKGLVSNIIPIKKKGKVICQKIIVSQHLLPDNFSQINREWIPVWHGTKFRFLESIIQYGLKPSGTKLSNGNRISPLPGHISEKATIDGIKNWAKAIFVSPSIFYSSDVVYAERIISRKKTWAVLVEGRLKPDTFTKHSSTVLNYNNVPGEPDQLEYRVEQDNDDELIYRIPSETNIFVTSISFISVNFLDNVSEYIDGNIVVNSEEEKMLLEV